MAVAFFGFSGLEASLKNIAEKSSRGSREAMEKGARDIQALAVRQAPVDEGNLEESIKIEKERGVDGRNVFYVFVDESQPADNGKTVGDYAMRMHDGPYNLGLRSEQKQGANPDIMVGPKFLERAIDSLSEEIEMKAEAGLKIGLGH